MHVATRPGPPSAGPLPGSAVSWHALSAPLGLPHLRLLRAGTIRRLAARISPDVVVERYHNFGGEGLLAARHGNRVSVLEVNSPIVDYTGSPKRMLDRAMIVEPMRRWRDWQCRHADLIVTPVRSILPPWLRRSRVLEAEWGADTQTFTPTATGPLPFTREPGDIIVVFAGAFAPGTVPSRWSTPWQCWKRVACPFAPSSSAMGRRRPAFGRESRARAATRHRRRRDAARRLPAALAAADIGAARSTLPATPPLSDAFFWSPLKIFEYMASGLPVVTPDIPRLRALIGDAGLLYDASRRGGSPARSKRWPIPHAASPCLDRRATAPCALSAGSPRAPALRSLRAARHGNGAITRSAIHSKPRACWP